MRITSGTMSRVSPRSAEPADDDQRAELRRLGKARRLAHDDLKAAVLRALASGASVRTVAADAQVSTATVQNWKSEAQNHPR